MMTQEGRSNASGPQLFASPLGRVCVGGLVHVMGPSIVLVHESSMALTGRPCALFYKENSCEHCVERHPIIVALKLGADHLVTGWMVAHCR